MKNRFLSRKLLRNDNGVVVLGKMRRNRVAISSHLPSQKLSSPVISTGKNWSEAQILKGEICLSYHHTLRSLFRDHLLEMRSLIGRGEIYIFGNVESLNKWNEKSFYKIFL